MGEDHPVWPCELLSKGYFLCAILPKAQLALLKANRRTLLVSKKILTSTYNLGHSCVMGYNVPNFGDKSIYNNLVKYKGPEVQFKLKKKKKKYVFIVTKHV